MNLIEQDVIVNGIRLHVYRTGAGKPPLIFAHGFTDNGLCYAPIAGSFADDFEIILYDSRFHGKSEAPAAGGSIVDRAHDLAGLVKALGLEKPTLIGHSMGAVTVILCAGLYPDLPLKVVQEDPPPFETLVAHTARDQAARNAWQDAARLNKHKSIQELVTINRQDCPTWPEAERIPWAQAKQQFSPAAFDEIRLVPDEVQQAVAQIHCPVLILTADLERGSLYPPAAADALAARLPSFRHVHIPGAGHNIRREQPAAFLKAVHEFLETSA